MSDVVVTVPKRLWQGWIAEGCLPGEDPPKGVRYVFGIGRRSFPDIRVGARVYIVAHGRLRGYAPLVDLDEDGEYGNVLVRKGEAVAVTIPDPIPGFRGWRYRWWPRSYEIPFPDWQTAGVQS